MKYLLFYFSLFITFSLSAQEKMDVIDEIDLSKIPNHQIKKYWLNLTESGMAQSIQVPILIAKGSTDSIVLGITAAIHGNELNGIGVIQRIFENLDIKTLKGTIIAVPGLNAVSIPLHERKFIDDEDLNRIFPGKENGNRSQQYVWKIKEKILPHFDYLIDMHTASFGRENCLYVRADLRDDKNKEMALLQDADIILDNKGVPSATDVDVSTRTMRAEAMLMGIPTITIEYGNPQVFQDDMIQRGVTGIENTLAWLQFTTATIQNKKPAQLCSKSYWLYVDQGGYLTVTVDLLQSIKKGDQIAILRNPFGDTIKTYFAPQDGIVIGRSSNPINMSGGRIIHLGIF